MQTAPPFNWAAVVFVCCCLLLLSGTIVHASTPGVCPTTPIWPTISASPLTDPNARINTIDESNGVYSFSLYPTLLNSILFASWSSAIEADPTQTILASRFYAERSNTGGITPPTFSIAYFPRASAFQFVYSPTGFIDGNVNAGDFDNLFTIALHDAFEFMDNNGDGAYSEGDHKVSNFDLATIVWDTPCTTVTENDVNGTSSGTQFLNLTSLVFNSKFSNFSLQIQLQYGTNGSMSVETGTSQGLSLDSNSVIMSARLLNYDFTSTTTLLGVNITILGARQNEDDTRLIASYADLAGNQQPTPTVFNTTTNTTMTLSTRLNFISNDLNNENVFFLQWNEQPQAADNTNITIGISPLKPSQLSALSTSAQLMFLNDTSYQGGAVTVAYFTLAFSQPNIKEARISFKIGFIHTDASSMNYFLYYLGAGILVSVALICAGTCLCYAKRAHLSTSATGTTSNIAGPRDSPRTTLLGSGSGSGGMNDDSSNGVVHVASPDISTPESYSPPPIQPLQSSITVTSNIRYRTFDDDDKKFQSNV